MSPRVGSVGYLNAAPLIAGLDTEPGLELRLDTPAGIARELAAGTLDLGLVPVIEAARQRLFAVPGPAIAARGAVLSVLVHARAPLEAVRTVALDPASRTSAVLVQVLFERTYGTRPRQVQGPPSGDPLPGGVDAALVIGDRALLAPAGGRLVADLGRWWREATGLPFVFAVWAGGDEATVRELGPIVLRARARGLAALDAIAKREGEARGIAAEIAQVYLRDAIHYDLGRAEREGLACFLDLARTAGEIETEAGIRWIRQR